jgi:hypothetical protein
MASVSKIPTLNEYKSILKRSFTNRRGDKIIVAEHLDEPAYLHLTGPLYLYSDLLDRSLAYLKKMKEVAAEELTRVARIEKYPLPMILSVINRLRELENIGYINGVFIYYEPSPDAKFRQAAIDEY